MAVTAAHALLPALLNDDMAELGPATEEASIVDDPATHPCAEREHDEVLRSSSGTTPPFGERCRARVVLDRDRKPEPLTRPGEKVDVVEREVHRVQDAARPSLEVRRNAIADRGDAVVEECLH